MNDRLAAAKRTTRQRIVRGIADILNEANKEAKRDESLAAADDEVGPRFRGNFDQEVILHFADPPTNLYQVVPWLRPLEALDQNHRVLIVTRSARSLSELSGLTSLPAVDTPTIGDFEALVDASNFKVCLYVNQFRSNFQAMRMPDMFHVNMSHGESEKLYMASNQAKAYDYMLVAGDAAVDRYARNLISYDLDRLIKIGRPGLDYVTSVLPSSDRPTLCYAPTWEGDRPSMRYSSVPTFGVELLRRLLASKQYRVIFRPHPFTGKHSAAAQRGIEAIRELMAAAATDDPHGGHQVNESDEFNDLAAGVDLLVCDNSAVLVDFLATGRPMILTEPDAESVPLPTGGVADAAYRVSASDVETVEELLTVAFGDDPLAAARGEVVDRYFGDVAPGAATGRFLQAIDDLIVRRDDLVAAKYRALEGSPEVAAPAAS